MQTFLPYPSFAQSAACLDRQRLDKQRVLQGQFLNLPIELFINWLIIKSAEKDGDPVPEEVIDPANHGATRAYQYDGSENPICRICSAQVPRAYAAQGLLVCSPEHARQFAEQLPQNDNLSITFEPPKQRSAL